MVHTFNESKDLVVAHVRFFRTNFPHYHGTTEYDNTVSIGVMRKLSMRIEKNLVPDPPWLQVVGILQNHSQ